jgi:hypothetical protein
VSGTATRPGTLAFTKRGGPVGAVVDDANKAFRKRWHAGDAPASRFAVGCVPLQDLLDVAGLADINLFSLDVEGAEALVLGTLDLAATNIEYVLVELDGHNPAKDAEVRRILAGGGFLPAAVNPRDGCCKGCSCTANELFVNPEFAARKGHAPPLRYKYGTAVACSEEEEEWDGGGAPEAPAAPRLRGE